MQTLHAVVRSRAPGLLHSRNLDAVHLFCLLGITVSIAAILHVDIDGLSQILALAE